MAENPEYRTREHPSFSPAPSSLDLSLRVRSANPLNSASSGLQETAGSTTQADEPPFDSTAASSTSQWDRNANPHGESSHPSRLAFSDGGFEDFYQSSQQLQQQMHDFDPQDLMLDSSWQREISDAMSADSALIFAEAQSPSNVGTKQSLRNANAGREREQSVVFLCATLILLLTEMQIPFSC